MGAEALAAHAAATRAALAARPDDAAAWLDLAVLSIAEGRAPEAEQAARRAMALAQPDARAWMTLGAALRAQDRIEAALAAAGHAASLAPASADPPYAMGVALAQAGRHAEAATAYRAALALQPDHASAEFNLALALLLLGDYAAGFRHYEARFRGSQPPLRPIGLPPWDGSPLPAGTPLLLRCEQGFGDTLQFIRFAPLAAARGARVILLAPAPLGRLLRTAPGIAAVIAGGGTVPRGSLTLPLLSLPHRLGTTLATLPAAVAYLAPPAAESLGWAARLAARPGLRVGLCWRGSPQAGAPGVLRVDARRSIPVPLLAPLAAIPGIAWVNLAKDATPPAAFRALDPMPAMADFAATAALVASLDLVVTVDTAVAHLAGALGRPVWLLNRADTDWRWLLGRQDSPWYPTLRQFRQTIRGDWAGPVQAAAEALAQASAGAVSPEP